MLSEIIKDAQLERPHAAATAAAATARPGQAAKPTRLDGGELPLARLRLTAAARVVGWLAWSPGVPLLGGVVLWHAAGGFPSADLCTPPAGAACRMDENLTALEDMVGGCERILRTPIPLSYTRHTSRFMVRRLCCAVLCCAALRCAVLCHTSRFMVRRLCCVVGGWAVLIC